MLWYNRRNGTKYGIFTLGNMVVFLQANVKYFQTGVRQ